MSGKYRPESKIEETLLVGISERGGTLIVNEDGPDFTAWLSLHGNVRLEIDYRADNYPCLNVRQVEITDAKLSRHINKNIKGWIVRKSNCAGVKIDKNSYVL